MRIGFIGDVVGRPGRTMIKEYLEKIRKNEKLDFVIANYENASHGFGITLKNANEMFAMGIDVMTGGNHTWDKKDIDLIIDRSSILRPHNYPSEVKGTGCRVYDIGTEKLAVINLMGHYGMPYVDNVFRCAETTVELLHNQGIKNIFIDFHAEATSEKRGLLMMLQGKVSAIIGTHTHVGTDDLQINQGTAYLTDIGLTGCRDNVIGIDEKIPLEKFRFGVAGRFEVPEKCKKILQMVIVTIENGEALESYKIKIFDDGRIIRTDAWIESR